MECCEHHVGGVQRVDKVGGHGVLLFPGVGRVAGVPGHPHVETLELSAHLQNSISEVTSVYNYVGPFIIAVVRDMYIRIHSACYCMSYGFA